MRTIVAGFLGVVVCAGPSIAGHSCGLGESSVGAVFPMPRAAKAIKETGHLTILVLGAGSSSLPGPDGARAAYPARLQAALSAKWPKVEIVVRTDIKRRRTAADMLKDLDADLAATKPSVVVWQTGTSDAVAGVEADAFSEALDSGVTRAQTAGADMVLMNMQYSPRTESMIAVGAYAQAMRAVALQREIPLFDRLSLMKNWSELGMFDFRHAANKLDTARQVHDCIGQLLTDLLVEAIGQASDASGGNASGGNK
jgi:hypothetical protein